MRRLVLAGGMMLAAVVAAEATLYLSERDGAVHLSGDFETGDDAKFAAFLAQPRAHKVRVIYLDSFGGSITAGMKIGRMIRKAHLATAVRAASARCDSACTLIFAGGVQRHYIGGETVFEGNSARSGLGYHPAHQRDSAWTRAEFSTKGTDLMAAYYREMGQPRAAELMQKAGFTTIFRPNGQTALNLNVATSLNEPDV